MTNLVLDTCAKPGCQEFGVFPGVDEHGAPCKWCFTHDPGAPEPTDDDLRAIEAEPPGWSDEVFAGVAAMVLDHTAMALDATPDAVEAAVKSLAEASGMEPDFAAGIIMATSWMASIGELLPEELSAGADLFEAQAEDAPIPLVPTTDDDELCRWCESPDHTTDDHERLYPQPWGHVDPDDEVGGDPCGELLPGDELLPLAVDATPTTDDDGQADDVDDESTTTTKGDESDDEDQ